MVNRFPGILRLFPLKGFWADLGGGWLAQGGERLKREYLLWRVSLQG